MLGSNSRPDAASAQTVHRLWRILAICAIILVLIFVWVTVSTIIRAGPPTGPTEVQLFSGAVESNDSNTSHGTPCSIALHCYTEANLNLTIPFSDAPLTAYPQVTLSATVNITGGPVGCAPAFAPGCTYYMDLSCPNPNEPLPSAQLHIETSSEFPSNNASWTLPCSVGSALFAIQLYVSSGGTVASFGATVSVAVIESF
jgi:hypothetical protein